MNNQTELTPKQIEQLRAYLAEIELEGLTLLSVTHAPLLDLLIIVDGSRGIVTLIAAAAFLDYGAIREIHDLATIYSAYPV